MEPNLDHTSVDALSSVPQATEGHDGFREAGAVGVTPLVSPPN